MPGLGAIACLALAAFACFAAPATAEPNVGSVRLGSFEDPVYVATAPGQPKLLFVVERAGRIRVMQDEKKLAQPFLDIDDIVRGKPDSGVGGEEGLLSVAFDPDYARSGRFYVFFNDLNGDIEIDEFRRSAALPTRADRRTRRVVLRIPHPTAGNHNGGQLQFGRDNLLYISVGDGGAVSPLGDPARRLNSLLGKILRIDPRQSGTAAYTVPPGNPFVGRWGRDEILAYGLRNPWRFSFDGPNLAVSDVGQGRREEVNILTPEDARGTNFGWPQYEGSLVFDDSRPGQHPAKFPLFEYIHASDRCAIIGGYVVRGPSLPEPRGRYIYGDACTGEVRTFIPSVARQVSYSKQPTDLVIRGLTSFGRGVNGTIYATQSGTPGAVYQLVPTP